MLNKTYLVDSHCHLHDEKCFSKEEQEQALTFALKNNVKQIICIGTDHTDSLSARDFVSFYSNFDLYWSYGIHPSEYIKFREPLEFLKLILNNSKRLVAIGEVGLDYHYGDQDRDVQIKLFEEMIDLAISQQLPLIFHIREAFDDFFAVISNHSGIRGVVHSFTDNKKNLRKSLDHGFYIGVNGLATYSTLPTPPLDRILLETDAPFLTPVPYRGQKNQSKFIKDVAIWLANKLQVTEEEVAKSTTNNVRKLFKI